MSMQNTLAIATDGYLAPSPFTTLSMATSGYILPVIVQDVPRFDPKAQFPKYGPTFDEMVEADDEDIINVIILATIFGILDD